MKRGLQAFTIIALMSLLAGGVVCAGESQPPLEIFPDSVSGNDIAMPDDNIPDDAAPGDDITDGAISDDAISDDAISDDAISDDAISDGAISDDAISDGATSDGDTADADTPDTGMSDDAIPNGNPAAVEKATVLSVTVPESLDFIMDPYELSGQGSIWSAEYSFVNKGNTPVRIYLSKLHCTAAGDVIIAESAEQMTDSGKQAALWLCMGNGDMVEITKSDSTYEITLNPQEALVFRINGKMNIDSRWKDGDIGISMLYCLEALQE